jgi:two-component system alkaline phosphatase synthesis response regulator PhoP
MAEKNTDKEKTGRQGKNGKAVKAEKTAGKKEKEFHEEENHHGKVGAAELLGQETPLIYTLEDDDNIRKLVSYALEREGYEVSGFGEPRSFHKAMDQQIPALVLLDIMLPEEDGLTILKKIRKNRATENLPVIMLTARDSEYDKANGLDMGADDYISKPFGIVELTSRLRAVLRRSHRREEESEIYEVGKLYVDPGRHIIRADDEDVELSYKEYCLLITLLEAEGRVVPREELLSRVWGEYYGESRTLDVHIRKLRVKLGDKAGGYIKTVKGIGYKLEINVG